MAKTKTEHTKTANCKKYLKQIDELKAENNKLHDRINNLVAENIQLKQAISDERGE